MTPRPKKPTSKRVSVKVGQTWSRPNEYSQVRRVQFQVLDVGDIYAVTLRHGYDNIRPNRETISIEALEEGLRGYRLEGEPE